jgi:hypothetical protein
MNHYCENCHTYLDSDDIIPGKTISEDEYVNARCGYCQSDNLREYGKSDLCPVCGYFWDDHSAKDCVEYILKCDCYDNGRECMHGEIWALRYIEDNYRANIRYMQGWNMTLKQFILKEPENFIGFVYGYKESSAAVAA